MSPAFIDMWDIAAGFPKSFVTNFPKHERQRYEGAIKESGRTDLVILEEAFDRHGNAVPNHFSVHCSGNKGDLSAFWNALAKTRRSVQ